VGVVISPQQASPEDFVTAIKRVLGDPTFRDNAQRMQAAVQSIDGLSIAADILAKAFELEAREG
jgi:UDP:flavonoid glycosyltransferase YjiC (YdhE family)